jgi:hypothetical protein
MATDDPQNLGFTYFGQGNGLPYCIQDYFVTGEVDEYNGVILEKVPPEGGWGNQLPLRLFAGFNPSFLTVNQVYNLAYNIEEITLSNSFTLLGYETEFTVPANYRFPSWGDRLAAFRASVEEFIEAGYPPDNTYLSYGLAQYREPLEGDPYWAFIFNGCSTTTTPSLENDGEVFNGTPDLGGFDYYYVDWGAFAGSGTITRIVDKDDYTPTGFYVGGGLTFSAQENSTNSFGGVGVSLGTGAPNPNGYNVRGVKSFNVPDPEGDYTLYATTLTDLNLQDESGNTVTIDSFKFREYA